MFDMLKLLSEGRQKNTLSIFMSIDRRIVVYGNLFSDQNFSAGQIEFFRGPPIGNGVLEYPGRLRINTTVPSWSLHTFSKIILNKPLHMII